MDFFPQRGISYSWNQQLAVFKNLDILIEQKKIYLAEDQVNFDQIKFDLVL